MAVISVRPRKDGTTGYIAQVRARRGGGTVFSATPTSDGGARGPRTIRRLPIAGTACGSGCEHFPKFYREAIRGEPAVFARLRVDDLPEEAVITQDDSDTGDKCHHLINGLGKKFYQRFCRSAELDRFEICDAQGPRQLTLADLERAATRD